MSKLSNIPHADDDDINDIITLSSDDEEDQVSTNVPPRGNKQQSSSPPKAPIVRSEVKMETEEGQSENLNPQSGINNKTSGSNGGASSSSSTTTTNVVVPHPKESPAVVNTQNQQGMPIGFNFDAFALFGPENASMPIEERLASFINNVQSLTEEKIKLETAERQAKRQCEEATTQLTSANQEISKLKENLLQSQNKISHQNGSISELQSAVDKLKKQENGSKTKLKSITGTLMNLQSKMVRILEETEMDNNNSGAMVPNSATFEQPFSTTGQKNAAFAVNADSGGSIAVAEAILKENIENFEKDFETKFSQIEEQDKEIKNELQRTNEMLQRIQFSLMDQFQAESSASSSPQLTHESMDDQDMEDDQIPGSSTLQSSTGGGSYNGSTRKVQR